VLHERVHLHGRDGFGLAACHNAPPWKVIFGKMVSAAGINLARCFSADLQLEMTIS